MKPVSIEVVANALKDYDADVFGVVPGIVGVKPYDQSLLGVMKKHCAYKGFECAIVPPDGDLDGYVVCTGLKES